MQIGVCLPNFSRLGTREATIEIARQAEALGYDSLWTTDHVMMTKGQEEPYGHILEALTTLTFVAALTERIRLGVSVLVFPPRNAVLVAKETATLDVLSGGRLTLGLGAGWNEREFQYLGAGFADRGKRFDEYIKALKELWTAEQPSFQGQWVQFKDVLFSPKPVRAGRSADRHRRLQQADLPPLGHVGRRLARHRPEPGGLCRRPAPDHGPGERPRRDRVIAHPGRVSIGACPRSAPAAVTCSRSWTVRRLIFWSGSVSTAPLALASWCFTSRPTRWTTTSGRCVGLPRRSGRRFDVYLTLSLFATSGLIRSPRSCRPTWSSRAAPVR